MFIIMKVVEFEVDSISRRDGYMDYYWKIVDFLYLL